jgi:hypothetical protein
VFPFELISGLPLGIKCLATRAHRVVELHAKLVLSVTVRSPCMLRLAISPEPVDVSAA